MTGDHAGFGTRLVRILMTEEAVYGLILVSGMIVVSGSVGHTWIFAMIAVSVTVVVFFAAHVYAGTLARLAASDGRARLSTSLRDAAHHSSGMLVASVPSLLILLLGSMRVLDDDTALWAALVANTFVLGALGWGAIAGWNSHWYARAAGAVITAAFGGVLILVKAVVSH